MNPIQPTLVEIYHPAFRKGYQDGRKYSFQTQEMLTDKHLVELLQAIFDGSEQEEFPGEEEGVYYTVGQLLGQISASVLPLQLHEDETPKLQEVFLTTIMQEYVSLGHTLAQTIRQFWSMQDQLAQTLDAENFEQMLNRGVEKRKYL